MWVAAVTDTLPDTEASPCTSCGACCAYSAAWPRFWTDTDDAIALIPSTVVAEDGTGMACDGDRCHALLGVVGEATRCSIYPVRPEVCRACQPGDDACNMARERYGLPRIIGPEAG
jgi:Fe-S-cluster containining protein